MKYLIHIAILLAWIPAFAAEPEPAKEEEPSFVNLPQPLEEVSGNIMDLEKSGHFRIVKAEYSRPVGDNNEALIWTVRVVKPLTCRNALMQLRYFRDVRFYDTAQGAKIEILSTLLYYSRLLDVGAVNRDILGEYDQFQLWAFISPVDVRKLTSQGGDTVEFAKWKR